MIRYRYALTLAYDGSHLYGFQTQKDGETVQSRLERALSVMLRDEIKIQAAGRTDSGVHSTGQVVSFRTPRPITEDATSFVRSIEALAGPHIQATAFHAVPYDFHPRFDCVAREYEYLFARGPAPSIFLAPYVCHIPESADLFVFRSELDALAGEHNFEAFTRKANPEEKKERFIDHLTLRHTHDAISDRPLISFTIRGNAFLHNMVRIIVGSLLDRALGRLERSLPEILASRDRTLAGHTAPPHGLYFRHAYYPDVDELTPTGLKLLRDYPVFGNSLFKQKLLKSIKKGEGSVPTPDAPGPVKSIDAPFPP